jgi:predicted transcriptional regulator
MWFKIETSKRGKSCSQCNKLMPKGEIYFLFMDFNREMKYPIKESWCKDCAMKIADKDFLIYIEQLKKAVYGLRIKLQQSQKVEQELGF